jgi:hypothetical protein
MRSPRASRPRAVVVAVALAIVALVAVHGSFDRPVRWTPDGLFYQARLLELRGASHDEAFRVAFEGPISERLRRVDAGNSGDPTWVAYNERFFERRVAVPLAGAAIEPVAGERALVYVSVAGYVAAVVALFVLLLLRFSLPVAGVVALATALMPALSDNAPLPHTDTWGLALLTLALIAAILTFDRGPRWLLLWVPAIVLLSFTRDSTWIAVFGAAFCAWRLRSRTGVYLALAGLAAAVPAALIFPVPLRELLAFAVSGLEPAPHLSWLEIAQRYPESVVEWMRGNAGFVRRGEWLSGLYYAGGLALLYGLRRGPAGDPARLLMRAAVVVAIAYLMVVPVFSAFRLELVLLPAAAFGFAVGVERLVARVRSGELAGGAVAPAVAARQPMRTS